MPNSNVVHRFSTVNGIKLHSVEAGTGNVVLLLHGFPEYWYTWRHQTPALANAGFRAIAVDMRGYNDSDSPRGVSSYRTKNLVADIARFIKQLGNSRVDVVGHDWGGIIAWRLAAKHPELLRKLIVLNAAHPAAYHRELHRRPSQWFKSSYVLLFQLPWLPEYLLSAKNYAVLERSWRRQPVRKGAFTDEDIARYKQALSKTGLTGPLNYYRAAIRFSGDVFDPPQSVSVPTMVIWGERDPFMNASTNDRLSAWVPDLRIQSAPDSSHWVQNESSELVNDRLVEFFQ